MNEVHVDLPIGIFKDGKRITGCTIRPMTGGTQKKLAQKNIRNDPIKLINTLLLDCVITIDGLPRINHSTLNSLYIGDRDFLALEIRKISRGNDLTSVVTCPHCREKLRMVSDLSKDIQTISLDDIEYTVVDDVPQFTVTNPNSEESVVFTFPDGNAQANSMRYIQKNPVEGAYAIMFNSVVSWNEKDRSEITLSVFDDLPLDWSDLLVDEFQNHCPGPIFEIPTECSSCGEELKLSMVSSDFLFRLRD